MNFHTIITKLSNKENLQVTESRHLMESIMAGELSDARLGAVLIALNHKGVSVDELYTFVETLREMAVSIRPAVKPLFDTCGTGGDQSNTFNISTVTAFVLAAADVIVTKHGNRSVSSACGSADVLERLGVNIALDPDQVRRCIERIGIGFLYAPNHHPAFRHVGPIRKELGVRTVFNLMGPLLNPANVSAQVIGVYDPGLTELFARTLQRIGLDNAMVVHGAGLDELTLCGATKITQLQHGYVETYYLHPAEAGLEPCSPDEITSTGVEDSARIFCEVLQGERSPRRDIVLLNAAAGLITAGRAATFPDGVARAADVIDSGRAWVKFEELRRVSHDLG